MIEHKEPFGVRVAIESPEDAATVEARLKTGFWNGRRVKKWQRPPDNLCLPSLYLDIHLEDDQ